MCGSTHMWAHKHMILQCPDDCSACNNDVCEGTCFCAPCHVHLKQINKKCILLLKNVRQCLSMPHFLFIQNDHHRCHEFTMTSQHLTMHFVTSPFKGLQKNQQMDDQDFWKQRQLKNETPSSLELLSEVKNG